MESPVSGELSSPAIVLHHQPGTDQKRFVDFRDGAGREAQTGREDVQAGCSFGEHEEILLLRGAKAERIDLLKLARPLQVGESDGVLAFGATDTPAGLQQAQSKPVGIAENLLRKWKQNLDAEGDQAFPGKGNLPTLEEELRRLRVENKRLQRERDILKKATAFFAKESP